MTAAARMTTTIPPKMRCRRWRLFHVATGDGRRSPMNERICFRPLCAEQFRQSMPQMRDQYPPWPAISSSGQRMGEKARPNRCRGRSCFTA